MSVASGLVDVPLHDPDFYLGDPYPTFARLRAEAPVYRCEAGGFWALSKHEDVLAVSKDPLTFCSGRGILIDDLRRHVPGDESVVYLDPPEHNQHRKLVNRRFHPRPVAALEPRVRELAVAALDALPFGEAVNVAEELAVPVPILVIAELLGIPGEDRQQFRVWSDFVISGGSEEQTPETLQGMADLYSYFERVVAERRRSPGDDLISSLLDAEVDGRQLTEQEILNFCVTLLVAGNETTRNLIAGSVVALAEHPDEWRRLREAPAMAATAVEELLRWVTPVMHFGRTATRDTVVRGQPIAEGEFVVMLYGSANRDEEVFGPTADRLDLGRDPNPHLAFGFAEHFCLGAGLARLEARIVLEELTARVGSIELAGPVVRRRSNLMRGIAELPAVLTAA